MRRKDVLDGGREYVWTPLNDRRVKRGLSEGDYY